MGIVDKAGKFVLNRVFGIMTPRQISASTLKVGRGLVDAARKGQTLTNETVGSIFRASVPKGMKTPQLLSTEGEVREFIMKGTPLPRKIKEQMVGQTLRSTEAVTIKNLKGTSIFSKSTAGGDKEQVINSMVHEFRHFLDFNHKMPATKAGMFFAMLPRPLITIIGLPISLRAIRFHQKYMNMQLKLHQSLDIAKATHGIVFGKPTDILSKSNKEVVRYLRQLLRKDMKNYSLIDKKLYLEVMNKLTASETAAYSQGGRVGRLFAYPGQKAQSLGEVVGFLQNQLLEAIKQEKALLKGKYLKMAKAFSRHPKTQSRKLIVPKAILDTREYIGKNGKDIERISEKMQKFASYMPKNVIAAMSDEEVAAIKVIDAESLGIKP